MKIRAISFAASILCLSMGAIAQTQTMQVAGKARNYILHAPTGLSNPPLVFVIHGFNMTGQQMVGITRMNAVADREKFVVVYPNALLNANNEPSWNLSGADDYALLMAIIDSAEAKHKIDRKRVYASGFSQGGFMTFQLGCRYSEVFAAIGPVSGTFQNPSACAPKRAVPMMLTFGTDEGFSVDGFIKSGTDWVKLNGCNATPAVQNPYPPTTANSVVTRSTYSSCREGTEVVTQSVEGGGHEWPMDTRTKVNNSEEIWAFFKKYSMTATSEISRRPVQPGPGGMRASLAQGKVRLFGVEGEAEVRVFDTRGMQIAAVDGVRGEFAFPVAAGGVYRIQVSEAGRTEVLKVVAP